MFRLVTRNSSRVSVFSRYNSSMKLPSESNGRYELRMSPSKIQDTKTYISSFISKMYLIRILQSIPDDARKYQYSTFHFTRKRSIVSNMKSKTFHVSSMISGFIISDIFSLSIMISMLLCYSTLAGFVILKICHSIDKRIRNEEDYDSFHNYWTQPRYCMIGLFINSSGIQELVGIIAIRPTKHTKVCQVCRFFLMEKYRRKGYGKLLMEQVIETANSFDFSKMVLNSTVTNEEAMRFYKKMDFRYIKTEMYATVLPFNHLYSVHFEKDIQPFSDDVVNT